MKKIFYKSILFCLAVAAVSCQKDEPAASISLSGSGANVTVSADSRTADVTILPEGGTAVVTVNSSASWKLIDDSQEPVFDIRVDGNDIEISAGEIISSHQRKTTLRILAGDNSWAYINVSQQGTDYAMLSLSNNRVLFDETGGLKTLSVQTNKDWRVEPLDDAKWLTVEQDKENGLIFINADINLVAEDIEASFRVIAGTETNNYSVDFRVYQSKWTEASFSFPILKQITLPADRNLGGRTTFEVNSNRRWHAETADSWIRLEQQEGALVVSNDPSEELLTGTVRVYTEPQEGEEPYEVEFTVRTDDKPMILHYSIPEGTDGVKVAAPAMAPFDIYIDWGDGSDGDISSSTGGGAFMIHDHLYGPGEYDIRVYGECGSISGMGVSGMAYLTEIADWGDLQFTGLNNAFKGSALTTLPDNTCDILAGVTQMNNAFAGCTSLEKLPPHMFSEYKGTQISGVFNGCTALKTIPADLFEGAESVTTMTAVFTFTGITEIPEGLLDPLVNLQRTTTLFRGAPVEKIPENLFAKNEKLLQVRNAFQETAITEIPANLFANNPKLQDIGSAFYSTAITEIPEDLLANNPEVYSVSYAFGYTGITEVPEGLFANCPNLSDVSYAFMGCTDLTAVPVNIFDNNMKLSSVTYLFALCGNLEGESPYTVVDIEGEPVKVHLYERNDRDENYARLYPMFGEISKWGFESCFGGCTKITDYDAAAERDYGKWVRKPNI